MSIKEQYKIVWGGKLNKMKLSPSYVVYTIYIIRMLNKKWFER